MMLGQDVHGKTLGVVGFGRIGQAVARRARGLRDEGDLLRPARAAAEEIERELGAERRELDDLLAEADFVSMHVRAHAADPAPVRRRRSSGR